MKYIYSASITVRTVRSTSTESELDGRRALTFASVDRVSTARISNGLASMGFSLKVGRLNQVPVARLTTSRNYTHTRNRKKTLCPFLSAAWKEMQENISDSYVKTFRCLRCAPGCAKCKGPEPCLATYHWPFRYLERIKRATKEFARRKRSLNRRYRFKDHAAGILHILRLRHRRPRGLHVPTP